MWNPHQRKILALAITRASNRRIIEDLGQLDSSLAKGLLGIGIAHPIDVRYATPPVFIARTPIPRRCHQTYRRETAIDHGVVQAWMGHCERSSDPTKDCAFIATSSTSMRPLKAPKEGLRALRGTRTYLFQEILRLVDSFAASTLASSSLSWNTRRFVGPRARTNLHNGFTTDGATASVCSRGGRQVVLSVSLKIYLTGGWV